MTPSKPKDVGGIRRTNDIRRRSSTTFHAKIFRPSLLKHMFVIVRKRRHRTNCIVTPSSQFVHLLNTCGINLKTPSPHPTTYCPVPIHRLPLLAQRIVCDPPACPTLHGPVPTPSIINSRSKSIRVSLLVSRPSQHRHRLRQTRIPHSHCPIPTSTGDIIISNAHKDDTLLQNAAVRVRIRDVNLCSRTQSEVILATITTRR